MGSLVLRRLLLRLVLQSRDPRQSVMAEKIDGWAQQPRVQVRYPFEIVPKITKISDDAETNLMLKHGSFQARVVILRLP